MPAYTSVMDFADVESGFDSNAKVRGKLRNG